MDPGREDVEVGPEPRGRQQDQPDDDRGDEAKGKDDEVGPSDGAEAGTTAGSGRRSGRGRWIALYRRIEAQ
jgi:hypothetical protein